MDKEVRFTEKKVDETWKQEASREKGAPKPEAEEKPALTLGHFVTSLGFQTLMHLGELPSPETRERRVDLEAAKETIDLLILLDSKTRGNQTAEEEQLFKNLLPELQMKFVSKADGK